MAKSSNFNSRTNIEQFVNLQASEECRVCLKSAADIPIFGDHSHHDVSIEITMFGGIHVLEQDDLPKYICQECFQLLEAAIEFRRSAKRSDMILKRRRTKKGRNLQNEVKLEFDVKIKSNDQTIDGEYELDHSETEDPSYLKNELCDVDIDQSMYYNVDIETANNVEELEENDAETVIMIISEEKEKPKKEIITCKHCSIDFQTEEELEEHKNTVEHKRNYVISFLPKRRKKKSGENQTTEKKTVNPKDCKCDICNRLFTKLHYPRHMQTQHKIKMETSRSTTKKKCTICDRMFHPVALNRHMKKAHCDEKDLPPKVKIECPVCNKMFSKDFYPLHINRHKEGDKRNFICDQCGKKFFFKSTFYTHRLIHSNELPHKCDYCPYRGRTKGLLKTHVRTHTGDYRYKCTQCDTRCLTKSNLNAHMQRHRGPIDFICDTCKRGFYSKLDLERHISVIHMGIKNHICNICGMAFGYRHGLMSHQLNVHKRAKGLGKAKAVYLKLEEEGVLQPQELGIQSK